MEEAPLLVRGENNTGESGGKTGRRSNVEGWRVHMGSSVLGLIGVSRRSIRDG